jgi:hypothetical protein
MEYNDLVLVANKVQGLAWLFDDRVTPLVEVSDLIFKTKSAMTVT